ncbi:MAG: type IV pilin N-terminal domain-containing protein [Thermoplasmata archaeon]|nr:type IV pilin N-terminal domain-containing protein [Thermoplasmata archaeon]
MRSRVRARPYRKPSSKYGKLPSYGSRRSPVVGGFYILATSRSRTSRLRRSKRGVSDVIGTILLLALTVTLFGSVFFFVNTFPRPPPQPVGQFSAALDYSANGGQILQIDILHLAGPSLADQNCQIYLASATHPAAFTAPSTIGAGLGGSTSWVIGQTWSLNVQALGLSTPDTITVSIVCSNQLLFRQSVPGTPLNIPPEFVQSGTTPTDPILLHSFGVFVGISDPNLNVNSVFANFSELPGLSSATTQQLTFNAASGTFQCSLPKCSIPSSWANRTGIFYIFVNASDVGGLQNSIAIPVDIISPGSSGSGSISIALSLNQTAPVVGVPISVIGTVTNGGTSGGNAAVNLSAGATALTPANGFVGAGTSVAFSATWTPLASNIGPILVEGTVIIPGIGTAFTTLNLTVFPKVLLVAHNLNALGIANSPTNESALLGNALQAAGIPFTAISVPCKTVLPASISNYGVVIVDYGTNTTMTSCPSGASTLPAGELTAITNAWTAGANLWIVGADFWADNPCGQAGWATFATDFGLKNAACTGAVHVLPGSPTDTYTAGGTLLANGVASPYTVASTVSGSANFNAYGSLTATVNTAGVYSKLNGADNGFFRTSTTHRTAILSIDPMMLVHTTTGLASGTGAGAAEVVYNVVDYLAGISQATTEGRAAVDFAVSEVAVVGTVHTAQTTVFAGIRSNGPSAAVVTVQLYVNGAPALYNGVPVTAIVIVTSTATGGGWSNFVSLIWQAPAAGGYTISVVVVGPGDLVAYNNGLPASLLNLPTTFT